MCSWIENSSNFPNFLHSLYDVQNKGIFAFQNFFNNNPKFSYFLLVSELMKEYFWNKKYKNGNMGQAMLMLMLMLFFLETPNMYISG